MRKSLFWLLSITTLEQWSLDEWDIDEVTFPYLNTTSANFQQDPYSHLEDYRRHGNKYINTTSSISIRLYIGLKDLIILFRLVFLLHLSFRMSMCSW